MKVMVVFFLIFSPMVYGAGFDCNKASKKVENIICGDEKASYLDSKLSDLYKERINRLTEDEKIFLRLDQKKWLFFIRNKCTEVDCVISAYQKRIDEVSITKNPSINYIDKTCFKNIYGDCDIELLNQIDSYIEKNIYRISNSYYDENEPEYSAKLSKLAEDAQQAWKEYRNYHCGGVVGGVTKGGSGHSYFVLECKILLSKQRLEILLGKDYGG